MTDPGLTTKRLWLRFLPIGDGKSLELNCCADYDASSPHDKKGNLQLRAKVVEQLWLEEDFARRLPRVWFSFEPSRATDGGGQSVKSV